MERAVLIAVLVIYLFTSVRWHRQPREEDDLGKLLHTRVTERRTVEMAQGPAPRHPDLRSPLTISHFRRSPPRGGQAPAL